MDWPSLTRSFRWWPPAQMHFCHIWRGSEGPSNKLSQVLLRTKKEILRVKEQVRRMLPGKKLLLRRRQKSADAGRRDRRRPERPPDGVRIGQGPRPRRAARAQLLPQLLRVRASVICTAAPANDSRDRQAERPASHSADTCARWLTRRYASATLTGALSRRREPILLVGEEESDGRGRGVIEYFNA